MKIGICSKCELKTELTNGRRCRACISKYNKIYHKKDYKINKEKRLLVNKKSYLNNKEKRLKKQKIYNEKNKEKISSQRKSYRNAHLKDKAEYDKIYRKNNRNRLNALSAKRHASKLKRTPKWLTKAHFKEIQEFYILAKELQWLSNEPLEVDHIIPLQGKNVSGLHVPWNLQILNESDNLKKHSDFDGTYDNNGWRKK